MMRALTMTTSPVEQAYDGGDTLNVRRLQEFHSATSSNMVEIERGIRDVQMKVDQCYEFISWVQKFSPDTLTAYKAHNTVQRAFDKADGRGEMMAESSAS